MSNTISFRITNAQTTELLVELEPWGDQYRVPAQKAVAVVAQGPVPTQLEVIILDTSVRVCGWVGSIVDISLIGDEPQAPESAV